MKTTREVLGLATAFLRERGVNPARRHAEELLAAVLGLRRLDLYMQIDRPLEEGELDRYREFLRRRARREPLQYIVGDVDFYHGKFWVNPAVLIPRPETEELVELVLKEVGEEPKVVWDLCTGSGCIGISLKKERPLWSVVLSDVSASALEVARKNAVENGVEVEFLQGDLLEPFEGRRADVVVCNPPYVTEEEFAELEPEVQEFEPRLALVGGLEFYERLAQEIPAGVQLFLEIGSGQGAAVRGLFGGGRVVQDGSGRDRFYLN